MKSHCEKDCYNLSAGLFKRTENEAADWPDKNMPIDLCEYHCKGRTPVKIKIFEIRNGKLIIETTPILPVKIKNGYTLRGCKISLRGIAKQYSIGYSTLHHRLKNGYSMERAIDVKSPSLRKAAKKYKIPHQTLWWRVVRNPGVSIKCLAGLRKNYSNFKDWKST